MPARCWPSARRKSWSGARQFLARGDLRRLSRRGERGHRPRSRVEAPDRAVEAHGRRAASATPRRFDPDPALGLFAARDDGAPARSDPPDLRLSRAAGADDRFRLRHFLRSSSALHFRRLRLRDNTPESRQLIEAFRARAISRNGPRSALPTSSTDGCAAASCRSPSRSRPASAATCNRTASPEVAVWLDGAMPFRAETTKGYVTGLGGSYAKEWLAQNATATSAPRASSRSRRASATIRPSRASTPWCRA